MAATPLLSCGWEVGDIGFYKQAGWNFTWTPCALATTHVHKSSEQIGGQYSLFLSANSLVFTPNVDSSARWVHFWVYQEARGASYGSTFRFFNVIGSQISVNFVSTGHIVLRRGSYTGAVLATSSLPISWGGHWVAIEAVCQTSGGVCNIYVDGVLMVSYSGNTQGTVQPQWGFVCFWDSQEALYIDDLFITDATDGMQPEMYGYAMPVVANGTSSWTPYGLASWENVSTFSLTPVNYNLAPVLNFLDTYQTSYANPRSVTVGWVGVNASVSSTGGLGVYTAASVGTLGLSSVKLVGGPGTVASVVGVHPINAGTGLAWTQSDLGSLQIGLWSTTI